jgi:ribosomal protein L7/L12
MNMNTLVESLTVKELDELACLVHLKRMNIARSNAKQLTEQEITLLNRMCLVEAMKEYRTRNKCSIMEAKAAIDVYRGM